ncbi:MAG: trimethylamine methyltransferase family protein [Deltaproteobacteria bacterium]|jgi:trimethylamine--corrinoid protein Co-methyltransferase|nr:trimethylamine methyltransferase family protein [Deltaproteobacteria bacterium]
MYTRMQTLSNAQIEGIHEASLAILKETGIVINDPESVEIFRRNGVRTDGKKVFPSGKDIEKALASCPETFTVKALNPANDRKVGLDDFVMLPGYGAPFVTLPDGSQRRSSFRDYVDFVKLVQTSPSIDMNGFLLVEPCDSDHRAAHLDMLLAGLLNCDKPLMGTPVNRKAASDCVEVLATAFGGQDRLMDHPASISLINSLSPLQFSEEMASSLVQLARGGQAVCVAALIMCGSSGPITIPGVLTLQNAEILAGLTLAQLARPGTPVIYGSTSSAMDLKSGSLSCGAPELSMFVSLTAQMARHYRLPSRSGGGLTDALSVDAQAGAESALSLFNAVNSGVNFILHAAGILGSYISMSFEKFLLDEELGAMVRRMVRPMAVGAEEIDAQSIVKVGPGGHYLTQPRTTRLCRKEIFQPRLMNRLNLEGWTAQGSPDLASVASGKLKARLESWKAPDLPPSLRADILAKARELAGEAPLLAS